MKLSRILPLSLVGLALASSAFGTNPPSATSAVDRAVKSAKAKHKGVIVIFHASWCGWCKQLDKTMEVPAFKSIMDKDFVILHVTVMENPAHKADENPGGMELMAKLGGGPTVGIPYFASLDDNGDRVADSMVVEGKDPNPQNMGFPTEPVEITHFLEMLKLSNPGLTDSDAATLKTILEARAAEIKAAQSHSHPAQPAQP